MKKTIAALLLLLAALFLALYIKDAWPYFNMKHKNNELKKEYLYEDGREDTKDNNVEEQTRQIDFAGLQALNPDIVAWITVPGTPIDYPILKENSNDFYYLTHDFTGAYSPLGSVFLQKETDPQFMDQHTILYAHNLVDDQMFGSLSVYAAEEIRDAQPYIFIYLPEKTLCYEIYSAYECLDGSETYQTTYGDPLAFQKWIDFTIEESNYNIFVPDSEESKKKRILTLSTCTDSGANRFVVHGVQKQGDEN